VTILILLLNLATPVAYKNNICCQSEDIFKKFFGIVPPEICYLFLTYMA